VSDPIDRLLLSGFCPDEAVRRNELLERARQRLASEVPRDAFDRRAEYLVPGRIEVLGKHTDYAGGRSLVSTTEQGLAFVAAPRQDGRLIITDVVREERAELALDPEQEPRQGSWEAYPRAVARRLARDFDRAWLGVDLAFASDLPIAAGVSSSSALVVGCLLAIGNRNRWSESDRYRAALTDPIALASYAGAIENGRPFGQFAADHGVGTLGGNQDQTAILCAQADHLTQFAWIPGRREAAIRMPDGWTFAVAASGVVAEKTGSALPHYNDTARRTARIWELARPVVPAAYPTLGAALGASDDLAGLIRDRVAREAPAEERERLLARLDQLRDESEEIVPGVASALARGDRASVKELVSRSQAGAEEGLRNQVPETRALVLGALAQGAIAASGFGAGFGGSVWAMVDDDRAPQFLAGWRQTYTRRFPERAHASRFHLTRPAPPAVRVR